MKSSNGVTSSNTQFSVFLANKPGLLAHVCQSLAESKINILAMSMMDSTEHGVLRLVAEDPELTRQTLARLNIPMTETTVLLATLPNRPGALAHVVEQFSSAHISVNYAYCTTGAPGGKTLGVFRVSDPQKASKILAERQPRRRLEAAAMRKPAVARRR